MLRQVVLGSLLALATTACQRPSPLDCERLCWKYAELQYWAAFEQQARDLSPADREALRGERASEWKALRDQPQNHGRDNCMVACRRSGTTAHVACVEKATTAAA